MSWEAGVVSILPGGSMFNTGRRWSSRPSLAHRRAAGVIAVVALLSMRIAQGQTVSLALASGAAAADGTTSLNLRLTSEGGNGPSALQWTFAFAAGDVVSVSAAAGPAASSAGKTLNCLAGNGTYSCLLYSMDAAVVPDGVVAE